MNGGFSGPEKGRARPLGAPDRRAGDVGNIGGPSGPALPDGSFSDAFSGAVLAGGESRRMGRDKALLRCAGEPLWRRQARVLTAAGASPVVVVRRPGQRAVGAGLRVVRDEFTGVGPLAGLHAALNATDARWLAVLAVDMPAVDGAWFARLRARCRPGVGAVARHGAGFEPLAAIYPREALAPMAKRLAAGRGSLQEMLAELVRAERMAVLDLKEGELWRMENWNRPGDRRAAR